MKKINVLKKRLKNKERILLNGGTGTEILNRGFKTSLPLWSAEILLTNPDVVQRIHEDYIKAGAEIIVTDTFRTTQRSFAKKGLSSQKATQITKLAVKLAKNAIKKTAPKHIVYIAGSVAPLEDCYSPVLTPTEKELRKEHYQYVKDLKDGGVDFLLIETQITIKEIRAALDAAKKLRILVGVTLCVDGNLNILGGESLQQAIAVIKKYKPLFVGVNCISQEIATKAVKKLKTITSLPICVYAQGDGKPEDNQGWEFTKEKNIKQYVASVNQWIKEGAQIVGGCCGTNPSYIKAIAGIVKN